MGGIFVEVGDGLSVGATSVAVAVGASVSVGVTSCVGVGSSVGVSVGVGGNLVAVGFSVGGTLVGVLVGGQRSPSQDNAVDVDTKNKTKINSNIFLMLFSLSCPDCDSGSVLCLYNIGPVYLKLAPQIHRDGESVIEAFRNANPVHAREDELFEGLCLSHFLITPCD